MGTETQGAHGNSRHRETKSDIGIAKYLLQHFYQLVFVINTGFIFIFVRDWS